MNNIKFDYNNANNKWLRQNKVDGAKPNLKPGDILHDPKKKWFAKVKVDGSIITDNFKGSIHSVAANIQNIPSCNGWTFWYKYEKKNSISIDILREKLRSELKTIQKN